MDFSLVDKAQREKYFAEKGSYSAQDESGRLIINDDMDIALLMLYGNILYTGTSYAYALSRSSSFSYIHCQLLIHYQTISLEPLLWILRIL